VWSRWAGALYLAGYFETAGSASFVPANADDGRILLRFCLIERALLELGHELTQRLDWVRIPIQGLLEISGGADPLVRTGPPGPVLPTTSG